MSYLMKPNLILLPGLLNDARLWQHQADRLMEIANVSVADLTQSDTIAGLAADVLEQAPTGMFAMGGLSMGGYVALEIMRQAPERISALALIDTSARPDTEEASANRHRLIELAQNDFAAVPRDLMQKLLYPPHLDDHGIVACVTEMAAAVGKDAFIRQQHAIMHRIDSRPTLARIDCPTLLLCGREDKVTPVDVHEEMAALIPRATLTIVEHCGHLSALEKPEAVTEALRNLLQARPR
ncbi:MAG TPA: alpha/beta hydrolase [Oxalicibacterium sp.]|uniref:alpha/beta fold hydrolase n=1 Tax=Oxalicibacterium sp. TaxID=2766525 RepID=UPI002D0F91A4|nr:alpha/beta hydrolase [Oxalicibacterium sp.]HWU98672.1 alpha/beta hydrolase [Oxalicibacterium sp.]